MRKGKIFNPGKSRHLSEAKKSSTRCLDTDGYFDELVRPDAEEDFVKDFPTHDPNPEDLLFLQGYEGEMLREIVTEESDTTHDDESNLFPVKGGKGTIEKVDR